VIIGAGQLGLHVGDSITIHNCLHSLHVMNVKEDGVTYVSAEIMDDLLLKFGSELGPSGREGS